MKPPEPLEAPHTDGSPPPYESGQAPCLDQRSDTARKTEADAKWRRCPLQSTELGRYDIRIVWRTRISGAATDRDTDWETELSVYAKDVPRLMREGFHYNETNLRRKCSCFITGKKFLRKDVQDRGWTHARFYHLADIAKRGRTQWTAILTVYARRTSLLASFTFARLSFDKADNSIAWNKENQIIYKHYSICPEDSFNAVYDDKGAGVVGIRNGLFLCNLRQPRTKEVPSMTSNML